MNLKQEYEIDKESYYKSKKYVIKIFPENLKTLEALDIRERDQFINEAISAYINQYNVVKQQNHVFENLKKNVFQVICVIILFALLGAIVRFSMVYSNSNNAEMGNNFQKLFDSYHLR